MVFPASSCAPRRCSTAAWTYSARVSAPGLNCRVRRPSPACAIASPKRVLQDLQSHRRFSGELFDSLPSRWSTTRNRVEPQSEHRAGPGTTHLRALYLLARSVISWTDFRHRSPQPGPVIPPLLLPLRGFLLPRAEPRCRRFRRAGTEALRSRLPVP